MKRLEELSSLYGDQAEWVANEVNGLLERYRNAIAQKHASTTKLTASDAILITYGDSIQTSESNPLQTLSHFCQAQLADCISAIHLLPCFPYTSDDGFSVQDYFQIDPELGDWDDVTAMSGSFDIMLDAVVNHCSQHNAWFKSFLEGDPEFDDYFITADPDVDYSAVTRPRALPLLHRYPKQGGKVSVWTTFSEDQVDLNYHSAKVFVQVLDVLLFYVAQGSRFIRLDAIAFIWKELGTTCLHLPQAHLIIQLYRHYIEQLAPNMSIITETNVPHDENVSYFGDGHNEAHLVYNFTLPPLLMHSLHEEEVETLTRWANTLQLPSDEVCFFNFTASHDGVGVRPLKNIVSDESIQRLADIAQAHGGFVSMRDNGDGTKSPYEINCNYLDFATAPDAENGLRAQRFLLTQSVMLAMPGVPGIYYHSILGSENDRQAALDSGINRRINRQKLTTSTLEAELADSNTLRHLVFSGYRRLMQARRNDAAFDPFGTAHYQQQGKVFIIHRVSDSGDVYALHNFSSDSSEVTQLPAQLTDQLCGETVSGGSLTLQPMEYRWLKVIAD